jgi:ElaB/YqjD/DUF883 family membrane-anchored ribosome-binding protein
MTVNQQTLEGNWDTIKRQLHQRWSGLSSEELDSVHGNVEQLVRAIQRRTGEARDAVENYLEKLTNNGASMMAKTAESVRQYAETAQKTVQDAAEQAVDAVKAGYAHTERTVQSRPMESVAACFGAGLITGVVLGLLMRWR